jgi:hypothetical protein
MTAAVQIGVLEMLQIAILLDGVGIFAVVAKTPQQFAFKIGGNS